MSFVQKLINISYVHVNNFLNDGVLFKLCGKGYISERSYSTSVGGKVKVTVVGGGGKVGQPLCLMLKQFPLIDELSVYDAKSSSFANELNYIDTNCRVTTYSGKNTLPVALKDSTIVVLVVSSLESGLASEDREWYQNSQVVQDFMLTYTRSCPKAFLAVGTNPINRLVPMCCEMLKKAGCFYPSTVFGVTSLATVRANTFVAHCQGLEPEEVTVPIVGGYSEQTMVPLLSQTKPPVEFSNGELENLMINIRKDHSCGACSLPAAFAISRFVVSLVKGIRGYQDIVECAYVPSTVHPELKYLQTPIQLGPLGVAKNLGLPQMNDFEACTFENAVPVLKSDIKKGEMFLGVIEEPQEPCEPEYQVPHTTASLCKEYTSNKNK